MELCLIVSFLQMASSLRQQTVMAICVSLDMVQAIVIARSVFCNFVVDFVKLHETLQTQNTKLFVFIVDYNSAIAGSK